MKKKTARKKPSVRQSYHRGNVAQDLLAVGTRILEKERFEDISARRLCREIGVSISNFYNHFASFDDFLLVIATKGFEMRMDRHRHVVEQARSREEALIELTQGMVDFAIEHHQMFRLMFGQVEGARDAGRVLQSNKSFAVIVRAVYGQDIFRLDDLAWSRVHCIHAYAFLAFFHGLARLITLGHIYLPENSVSERRRFVEDATKSFIRGLPPEKRAAQALREKNAVRVKASA
jgi:AcrR family transcriptional regulator